MHLRGTMQVNEAGYLTIGGCTVTALAEQYGTPLYVIDEAHMRQMAQRYLKSFTTVYPNSEVIYAGKALLTQAICKVIEAEGLSLDVVSGGELFTAVSAGFPPEKIYFHGNNKSTEELELALEHGIGRVVVDNFHELELLESQAARRNCSIGVFLRITPGVEAHTHTYIQTGQLDSKFGFPLEGGLALAAVKAAIAAPHLDLKGVHCHIGSQIFDVKSFEVAVDLMVQFIKEVQDVAGYSLDELDLGGGLGIRYNSEDEPVGPEVLAKVITGAVTRAVKENGMSLPKLLIEPGRSIVGEAGTTLYAVGSIKDVPGIRRYVAVDGGMGDNPRVALYQARYEAVIANRVNDEPMERVSIAGKCCESGDMLIWDIDLPQARPGDILAVFSTGAYNYSMASNYNRLPKPAMVLVADGQSDLVVQRETYADLIRNDLVPQRLKSPVVTI